MTATALTDSAPFTAEEAAQWTAWYAALDPAVRWAVRNLPILTQHELALIEVYEAMREDLCA